MGARDEVKLLTSCAWWWWLGRWRKKWFSRIIFRCFNVRISPWKVISRFESRRCTVEPQQIMHHVELYAHQLTSISHRNNNPSDFDRKLVCFAFIKSSRSDLSSVVRGIVLVCFVVQPAIHLSFFIHNPSVHWLIRLSCIRSCSNHSIAHQSTLQ